MSVTINGTNGLTFNDNTTQATSPFTGGLGFRNRIINGDMRIDQRNNGASVTPSNTNYTLDRWQVFLSGGGAYTVQRSTVAPAGFVNSMLITVTTADSSIAAGDYYILTHKVEGNNVADLGWGTANAQAITLSFNVRSSITGTFSGALNNSAGNRSYPFTFTVSSANTWETKSINIPGDTSGTWATDTSSGIVIRLSLGMGSTYSATAGAWTSGDFYAASSETAKLISTNGATFYITGVQLEKGSTATSFDYRPYGTELALCQRYYEAVAIDNVTLIGATVATTTAFAVLYWKVPKRATPSITLPTSGSASGNVSFLNVNASYPTTIGSQVLQNITTDKANIVTTTSAGLAAAGGTSLFYSNGTSTIQVASEL